TSWRWPSRPSPRSAGTAARPWLDRLELDHPTSRAPRAGPLSERGRNSDSALRLAGALARFWWIGGHFREGSRWLERGLAAGTAATPSRMKALYGAGWFAHMQHDLA